MGKPLVKMENVSKSFSGNTVLSGVELEIEQGEVHALMGENGAGKSTLIKVLTGIHERDQGTVKVRGEEVKYTNPKESELDGIAMIHQELNIIPYLTVAENMFLGKELTFGKTGFLDNKAMAKETRARLKQLGVTNISPSETAGDLSVGKQQMIEIAKALATNAELIIMDEPTAALTDREIKSLFNVIKSLQKQNVSIIYVSHRMEEIFQICQRITVLRDGKYIGTEKISNTSFESIVKMMVGRDLGEQFPERESFIGDKILEVESLSQESIFQDVSFSVHTGEILGVAGLMGAGRTEIMESLFGYRKPDKGTIKLKGKSVSITHPKEAIEAGIGFITEDRKAKGLILGATIKDNISLTNMSSISNKGLVVSKKETELVQKLIRQLSVKATDSNQEVKSLSGGNQQKVVIAKWLGIDPKILILDEPTRGVDVGAKKEIYHIMNELTTRGVAIIMISSELPEILGISDRIMVIHEGSVAKIFNRNEANQEKIMAAAAGGIGNEESNRE